MNNKPIRILVTTRIGEIVEKEKVIHWNNADKKWLHGHMHWAFTEGRSVTLVATH